MFEKTLVPVLGLVENMSFFAARTAATALTFSVMAAPARKPPNWVSSFWARSRCCWISVRRRTPAHPSRLRCPTAKRPKPTTCWRVASGIRLRNRRQPDEES